MSDRLGMTYGDRDEPEPEQFGMRWGPDEPEEPVEPVEPSESVPAAYSPTADAPDPETSPHPLTH